ncbi:hypothetical protein QBC41DRAFT_131530 [Cercophora samala]|uniref:Uncharacterized protein n=1 Tax=Cercophora samala TaxID=330535 RepID=A0AA39ZBU5_9PEZI|nr:hypothetical protein QBC41DRAFT_131530 [Cercophora samala]
MADQLFSPPTLKIREARVITQIITRASTTITTLVTLGDPTAVADMAPTEGPPPPPPAAAAATLPPAPSSGTLSSGQLGALLGSVLGFAFLVLVICCCLSCRRRRRRRERVVFYPGTGSESSGSEREVRREYYTSTRDWNQLRGTGGLEFANAEGMMGNVGSIASRTSPGFTTVPPPARFPPTPRYTPYRQSRWPQISGVRRFP